MRWVIGARKSDLARLQAYTVGEALKNALPDLHIEYNFKSSLGDKNLTDPLWKAPEKGVFTEDFLKDLESGTCDLVVHSYKDLPTAPRAHTEIVAAPVREDARDVLLMKPDRHRKSHLTVMSSSPRRSYNLSFFLKDYLPNGPKEITWVDVRGNVPTRVRKLLESPNDGLVVAKAALDRLLSSSAEEFQPVRQQLCQSLRELQWMVLPLRENPTAAAQGALAIEVLKSRSDILAALRSLGSESVEAAVTVERERLKSFGGGCHLKLGITHLERPYGTLDFVRGITPEGKPLAECVFHPVRKAPAPASADKVWPREAVERGTAQRSPIEAPSVGRVLGAGATGLFVARADALPHSWSECVTKFSVLWTAGLSTWRKLARQGHWVHGSCEGLGERESPRLANLVGGPISWLKVTHQGSGGAGAWGAQVLATYKVERKIPAETLKGRTHFYWNSGTEFVQAKRLCPEIVMGYHFCGPGQTYDRLVQELGSKERVFVHLEGFSER